MSNVVAIKGTREAPKSQRSTMETLIVSIDQVNQWRLPPFQRPLRVNAKVAAIAEEMKQPDGQTITGVITLGKIAKAPDIYIVDGQHRIEAFRISGLDEVIADVRIVHFDTLSDMADEFVRLNSALVRMRPDDILRGLEPTSIVLKTIKKDCAFVGYDNIRRGGTSGPILSMAAVLRCWAGSAGETPSTGGGGSVASLAAAMDDAGVENLVRFLLTAHAAWGRDPEYYRLWANLNLTICMWLWRRLVLDPNRSLRRSVVLNVTQFKQCLMSVSADHNYVDWLTGRTLNDRDRNPAYTRIKAAFVQRLSAESRDGKKPLLPSPIWFSKR